MHIRIMTGFIVPHTPLISPMYIFGAGEKKRDTDFDNQMVTYFRLLCFKNTPVKSRSLALAT